MTFADETSALEPTDLRGLKRAEWDRLVELGYFEDERVELLNGTISKMSPQNAAHALAVQRLTALFYAVVADRAQVFVQAPFALDEHSEPEPDIALVVPPQNDHPTRAYLLIEVADSSLRKDRGPKAQLYATAGVPEYWIVNLASRVVEVYAAPSASGYQRSAVFKPGESIAPAAFPEMQIAIEKIFR